VVLVQSEVPVTGADRLLPAEDHLAGGTDDEAAPAKGGHIDLAHDALGKALPQPRGMMMNTDLIADTNSHRHDAFSEVFPAVGTVTPHTKL
jgi:hypothetical protein